MMMQFKAHMHFHN